MAATTVADRVFLGWSAPFLPAAADHLAAAPLDLTRTLIITPGARAGRILSDLIARRTGGPPRCLTPGQATDVLLDVPEDRIASPMARRLAWIQALRSTAPGALSPLVPRPPRDVAGWSNLAVVLEQAHSELAAERLLFADVPRRAAALPDFADAERWGAAAEVQRRYREILRAHGVADPDLLRLEALASGAARPAVAGAVLVGISELNAVARAALAGVPVVALIAAPRELSGAFDSLGCIIPEAWSDRPMQIRDSQIVFADSPGAQADHALAALAAAGDGRPARDCVIAVPDPEVLPFLERRAEDASLPVRNAAGSPLSGSAPYRLLEAIADYLDSRSFRTLGALVRHPDMERHLRATLPPPGGGPACEWWLAEMDNYAAATLHAGLDGSWHTTDPDLLDTLRGVAAAVDAALSGLRGGIALPGDARAPQAAPVFDGGAALGAVSAPGDAADSPPLRLPLRDWARPIAATLAHMYSAGEHAAVDSAPHEALADLVASIAALPTSDSIRLTAPEAIRFILAEAANLAIPPAPDPGAVELLGWLELAFDPSPIAVITGMNEGVVPMRPPLGPLLPDRLRTTLCLACDHRLHARDAYLLSVVLASRPNTTLICARRAREGDPLVPSRLLFAAGGTDLARRVLRFCEDDGPPPPAFEPAARPSATSRFIPRPIREAAPIESLAVTAFRTYIASPYLFYLQHIARLAAVEPDAPELDPLAYGSLFHDVLEAFGRGPERHTTDPARIEQFLSDTLADLALRRFGPRPLAAVAVQVAILRQRLREFARAQAAHRQKGWLIERVEWTPRRGPVPFDVDGLPFGLRGRIDRIDRHESDGRIALLDYKSGDAPADPHKSHGGPGNWKDLQLPLYRHIAAGCGLSLDPERLCFGLFTIPRRPGDARVNMAAWSDDDLRDADEAARSIIRAIRNREFSELGDAEADGVFAALCGLDFVGAGPEEAGDNE